MSSLHLHHLEGCAPTPLAHYLKALAILRLLTEQIDADARGFWGSEHFHLITRLDRQELLNFFVDQYTPSPLLAPWNSGSGFYASDNKEGLLAIAASQAPRFADYRLAITAASRVTREFSRAPINEAKAKFTRRWRECWRGPSAAWIDAVVVIQADGSLAYPALLGTGGNDGRLDFINNYMRQLAHLWDTSSLLAPLRPQASQLLSSALFGGATRGQAKSAIGQFLPGSAGGANQSAGFDAKPLSNPWDVLLMLEGTLVLRSSLVRRAESKGLAQAAAPFAVRGSAAGYGSAAEIDESARGEQWMPLWSTPTTYAELQQLFAEARCKIGERTAQQPLDFARAIARQGVARGIDAFERFGYIERNGQTTLAVPLGRWQVRSQPHQDLLDEVASWVATLRHSGRNRHAPPRLRSAAKTCEEVMLSCCRQNSAIHWRTLLMRLAETEQTLLRCPKFSTEQQLRPLPRLSSGWLQAIGILDPQDPCARELRLAFALASLHDWTRESPSLPPTWQWNDPIRRHWIPLDRTPNPGHSDRPPRLRTTGNTIDRPAEVVSRGVDLLRDAISVLRHRALSRGHRRSLGLIPAVSWAAAPLTDIAAFIRGEVDEERCLKLALALMALDWRALAKGEHLEFLPPPSERPGAVYSVLRLATPLAPIPAMTRSVWDPETGTRCLRECQAITTCLDPALLERLLAEDLSGAFRIALQRLQVAGLRPQIRIAAMPRRHLRRLAASLIFPISNRDLHDLAEHLTEAPSDDDHDAIQNTNQDNNPGRQPATMATETP